MKKIQFLLLMCILGVAGIVNAQEEQISEKKVSYSFFTEYGLSAGTCLGEYHPPFVEITGIFVNSICFNKKQDMIGIGVGCDAFYLVIMPTIPIFVNYRHNFPSKTNLKPFINVALGARFCAWDWREYGLYSTIAGGFRHKSLSFNLGILIKSLNDGIFIKSLNNGNYFGGVEIKIGYIFLK